MSDRYLIDTTSLFLRATLDIPRQAHEKTLDPAMHHLKSFSFPWLMKSTNGGGVGGVINERRLTQRWEEVPLRELKKASGSWLFY